MSNYICHECQSTVNIDDYEGTDDLYECSNRYCPFNPMSEAFGDLPEPDVDLDDEDDYVYRD